MGNYDPFYWNKEQSVPSFYDVKGVLDSVFTKLRCCDTISYQSSKEPYLKSESAADILFDGKQIGSCGSIQKDILNAFDIKIPVMLFDIDLSNIISAYDEKTVRFHEIIKYPPVLRDIAVVTPSNIEVKQIVETIQSVNPSIIDEVQLFDVYTGKQIEPDYRSLAFNITFQSRASTLTDEYVDELVDNIVKKLSRELQIELRQE